MSRGEKSLFLSCNFQKTTKITVFNLIFAPASDLHLQYFPVSPVLLQQFHQPQILFDFPLGFINVRA